MSDQNDHAEDEEGEEGWIYLPPEELQKLQRQRTEAMRRMLDAIAAIYTSKES